MEAQTSARGPLKRYACWAGILSATIEAWEQGEQLLYRIFRYRQRRIFGRDTFPPGFSRELSASLWQEIPTL